MSEDATESTPESVDDGAMAVDEAPKPKKKSRRKAASKGSKAKSAPKPAGAATSATAGARNGGLPTDVGALLMGAFALMLLLSLASFDPDGSNWIGWFGHQLADALLYLFGVSSFLFVAVTAAWGVSVFRGGRMFERYGEGVGASLILVAMAALCHLATSDPVLHHEAGGVLGLLAGNGLVDLVGSIGSIIVLLTMLISGGMLLTERSLADVLEAGGRIARTRFDDTRRRWADARAARSAQPAFEGPTPNDGDGDEDEDDTIDAAAPGEARGWTARIMALAGGRRARVRTPTGSLVTEEIGDDTSLPGDEPAWVLALNEDDDDDGDVEVRTTKRVKLAAAVEEPAPAPAKKQPTAPATAVTAATEVAPKPSMHDEIGPVIVESEAQKNRKRAEELDRAQQQRLQIGESLEWEFPPLSFLNYQETQGASVDREKLRDLAAQLEKVLGDFRVNGKVTGICPGPVVTLFEFEPDSGTKLSKISGLSDDIAMALKAHKVRIIAPIPGKGCVGIEVPNDTREVVFLKEILADDKFTKSRSKLTMALGKDIEGYPVAMDLAKSPHLLIAGTTGSGKSVAVNGMITSILYNATPDEVKLILIDPKQLEFAIYEGIPHLLLPVVTDPAKASTALQWAVQEMERRYKLMAEMKVRNLHNYNEKLAKLNEKFADYEAPESGPLDPMVELLSRMDDDGRPSHRNMYQLVVIVDEFADLMMVAGKEVEISVARLAQKARAAGIHCILATQRPSVDVITGLIKANFPTRISCRLMSGTDSRTVLDTIGAENLLGMGDMLYRPPGRSELQRVHGAFVDEEEIEQIVQFVNRQRQPEYDESILEAAESGELEGGSDEPVDELYDEAVAVVAEAGFASISMVQRKLRIGYNRSARIIEEMEREGVIGKAQGGSSRREVLVAPV